MNLPDLHCHSTFSSAMTSGDAAWLSGILEGEGWFGERRGEGRSPRPIIALKMCDRDIVERVAKLFGGKAVTLTRREIGRNQFTTRAQGEDAISIMQQILPWMGERRSETIEILLDMHEGTQLRKPSCSCGTCPKCRNREAQQKHRERKAA